MSQGDQCDRHKGAARRKGAPLITNGAAFGPASLFFEWDFLCADE